MSLPGAASAPSVAESLAALDVPAASAQEGLPPAQPPEGGGPQLRRWGEVAYAQTFEAMQRFTAQRGPDTPDELWLVEHPPVFTQGVAGKDEHVLVAGDIPVVRSNRGGQVTYHGPGQVVIYPLIDLKRLGIFVKEYVYRLETAVIQTLEACGVVGFRVEGAPGIYVNLLDPFNSGLPAGPRHERFAGLGKVAQLGIKVSQSCAYHGVSLNVAMDLSPFERINPCGYAGLRTVDLATLGAHAEPVQVAEALAQRLGHHLSRPLGP